MMESALPLVTRLRNDTVHSIDFSVENGTCPIPSLKPGGRRLVNLSEVVKICRRLESDRWLVKVLLDQIITGMTLDARQFLRSVMITFKIGRIHDGNFELIAEAIEEKPIDLVLRLGRGIGFVLRRNILWNRRQSAIIARSLVEFPLNMHQIRMEESGQGDVNAVPEAIVNGDTTRAREERTSHPDGNTDVLVRRNMWTSPERSPQRKTTTEDIILDGSKPDASEIRTLNSTRMETLDREGTDSYFHHHHSQQLLRELVECDNRPHPSNALNISVRVFFTACKFYSCAAMGYILIIRILLLIFLYLFNPIVCVTASLARTLVGVVNDTQ